MKKIREYFIIIKLILDFLIVFGSFFIAKFLRENINTFLGTNIDFKTIWDTELFYYSSLASVILVIVFSLHWLYSFSRASTKAKEVFTIILYSFYSFIFTAVIIYLWQWFILKSEIPRLIIGFAFTIWTILIIIERFILDFIQKKVSPKSKILIFSNSSGDDFYKFINNFKNSNEYEIIWVANNYKTWIMWFKQFSFEDSKELIKNREINEVLYFSSDLWNDDLLSLKEIIKIYWVKYCFIPTYNDLANSKMIINFIAKVPVIEIKYNSFYGWNIIFKRIFDFISSIFLIIIFAPLLILIALLIKLEDSSWPVIFKNRRVWRDGKEFDLYKFRYMKWAFSTKESYKVSEKEKEEALKYEQSLIKDSSTRQWPLYKIKNDPRKTRVWAFIEKYSIDELPQLFNVFLWDMSLVWPRPHQPREVKLYKDHHKRLLTIKPWITWMAQVNGRDENSFEDEVKLDIFYIDNWNVFFDLKIIFKTFFVVIARVFK